MRGWAVVGLIAAGCSSPSPMRIDAFVGNDDVPLDAVTSPWRRVYAAGTSGTPAPPLNFMMTWDGTEILYWAQASFGNGGDLWWFTPTSEMWLQRLTNDAVCPYDNAGTMVWDGTQALAWGGGSGTDNGVCAYSRGTNAWTMKLAAGSTGAPDGRLFASWVWTGSAALMFGGNGATAYNDLWSYSPTSNMWTELVPNGNSSGPTARQQHSAVWTGTQMLVYGGGNASLFGLSDLWSYTPGTGWSPLSPTGGGPGGRYAHAAVWTGTEMAVFGGMNSNGNAVPNDVWHYNPTTNTWRQAWPEDATGPARRHKHGFVWVGDRAYVFAGCTMAASQCVPDLWEYVPR